MQPPGGSDYVILISGFLPGATAGDLDPAYTAAGNAVATISTVTSGQLVILANLPPPGARIH